MTNKPDREIYIPFAEAASASGISPRRIRHWLERYQLKLDANDLRSGTDQRRFSRLDLVRLALIGRLTTLGVGAPKASLLVEVYVFFAALVLRSARLKKKITGPPSYSASDVLAYQLREVASASENDILDALRDKVITLMFYRQAEPGQESVFSIDLNNKDDRPEYSEYAPDTRVTIDLWRILESISGRLEGMDLK